MAHREAKMSMNNILHCLKTSEYLPGTALAQQWPEPAVEAEYP